MTSKPKRSPMSKNERVLRQLAGGFRANHRRLRNFLNARSPKGDLLITNPETIKIIEKGISDGNQLIQKIIPDLNSLRDDGHLSSDTVDELIGRFLQPH